MAIEKLKSHKSPVIDQIPAELIKAGGRTIRFAIHKLIISIWNKEELPEEWKESIIVPIHKKGDLVADSHSIMTRWRNYFSQLLNVHGAKKVRQAQIHTAEQLVPEPSDFEVELAIE